MGKLFPAGFRSALENEELPPPPVEGNEEETLAAAQLDVQEPAEEVGEIAESLEDATDLGEELQGYEEKVEAAGENGGLNDQAADVLQTAVESAYSKRFGTTGVSFPALESFGQTGTRLTATANALEGIRSRIGDVWKAIVEFIKRMVASVVGFFQKLFGAGEKLKKRAEAIAARSDITGKAEKNEFENPSLFAKVQVNGAVNVKSGIDAVLAAVTANTEIAKGIVKEGETMKTDFADPVKNLDKFSIQPINNGIFKPVSDDRFGSAGEGMVWASSAELMGGEAFVYRRPATGPLKGLDALKAMGKLRFQVVKFNPSAKAPSAKKLPVLKGGDIGAIAKEVEKIADIAIAHRATAKELESLLGEISKAAEKAASEALKNQETKGEDKAVYNALRGALGNYTSFLVSQASKAVQFGVTKGADALMYCEASIKMYK